MQCSDYINSKGILMMQSSITNLHKSFKYRTPDFPQTIVKEVMWICTKLVEQICNLPDIFRAHRLETEMINRTKFNNNRIPGIFTADKIRYLWVAKNYTWIGDNLITFET